MLKIDPETRMPRNPGAGGEGETYDFTVDMRPLVYVDWLTPVRRMFAKVMQAETPSPRRRFTVNSIRAFCARNAVFLPFLLAPFKIAALTAIAAAFWIFWTGTPA